MTSKSHIVMGEAQESDSEEEIDSSEISKNPMEHCKGKIVSGEAPESDEENGTNSGSLESVSSAVSALSLPPSNERKRNSRRHQSILVKKLYEKNISLHKSLNDFIEETAINAGNELNATNKRLLKCQVQMQEGADYLRMLNSNLSALDSNLQLLLSTSYLSDIKVNESNNKVESKPS